VLHTPTSSWFGTHQILTGLSALMKKASGEKAALVLLKVALLLLCKRAALHLCVAKGRILPCFA